MMAIPSADFPLANSNTAQSVFPPLCDTFTLEALTTYEFEGTYILNTGSTTHTTAMGFLLAGGASVSSFEYTAMIWSAAANAPSNSQFTTHVTGVTSKVLNTTSGAVYTIIQFKGTFRTNAGGTITPQITFSAAPNGINLTKVGSCIKFVPVGASSVQVIGNIT